MTKKQRKENAKLKQIEFCINRVLFNIFGDAALKAYINSKPPHPALKQKGKKIVIDMRKRKK